MHNQSCKTAIALPIRPRYGWKQEQDLWCILRKKVGGEVILCQEYLVVGGAVDFYMELKNETFIWNSKMGHRQLFMNNTRQQRSIQIREKMKMIKFILIGH